MAVADPVGAKFYIGPINTAANTKSAYAALSYVQVKSVDTIPQLGPVANVTKYIPLESGTVGKRKGSVDSGDPELVCFVDNLDAGQLAMIAARGTKFDYAMKVELPDAASASAANSVYYFHAKVTSCPIEVGAADNIPRRRFGLAITGIPTEALTV